MPTVELAEYFNAERQGGLLLVAMAVTGVSLAAYLWSTRSAFLAMAWPLVLLGLLQVAIGSTVAWRASGQITSIEEGLRVSPGPTAAAERERMDAVNRNFCGIKIGEVAVIVLSLGLVLGFPQAGTWSAIGLGLLIEAAALLAFDVFAQQRALVYTDWLQRIPQ
jgi:hypothetical protein